MEFLRQEVRKQPLATRVLLLISAILIAFSLLRGTTTTHHNLSSSTSSSSSSSAAAAGRPNLKSIAGFPRRTPLKKEEGGWEKIFPATLLPPQPLLPSDKVHITHVFSTFSVPVTSPAYREMTVVQLSLLKASRYARERRGIVVEFIDTTLPNDSSASPSFATRYDLHSYFVSANNDGSDAKQIPTVGEYFKIAHEHGRGDLVISTNADIGVVEDFYVRAYDWANRDYYSNEVQLEAMRSAGKFFADCMFSTGQTNIALENVRFCAQDAKQIYVNEGGFDELWRRDLVHQVALLAAKEMFQKTPNRDASWFETILSTLTQSILQGQFQFSNNTAMVREEGADWLEQVQRFVPTGIDSFEAVRDVNNKFFAGTITRLDFPSPDAVLRESKTPMEALNLVETSLQKIGVIHPGNDLFILHRDAIPLAKLDKFAHPTGLRPFGAWIPVLLTNAQIAFRRISSSPREGAVWSFHIGIGKWGGSKINFRERLEKNPLMTLFLVANFNRLGKGVFERQFTDAPRLCKESLRGWRDTAFCTAHPNTCVGMMRVSCEKYMNKDMRDPRLYAQECGKLLAPGRDRKVRALQQPVCGFCNLMLSQNNSCAQGQIKYCEHLEPGACGDAE